MFNEGQCSQISLNNLVIVSYTDGNELYDIVSV